MSLNPLRTKFDQAARWYDPFMLGLELLGVARLRRRLIERCHGKVLEVGAGTGRNLPYYPPSCTITGVDLSPGMLAYARERANALRREASFLVMDVANLDFPDDSFDTVVSTFGLCTFPDPRVALREMIRVCRDNGQLLFLEHGRSSSPSLGHWQDRLAIPPEAPGCHWNREPAKMVAESGLEILRDESSLFGVVHLIEGIAPRHKT